MGKLSGTHYGPREVRNRKELDLLIPSHASRQVRRRPSVGQCCPSRQGAENRCKTGRHWALRPRPRPCSLRSFCFATASGQLLLAPGKQALPPDRSAELGNERRGATRARGQGLGRRPRPQCRSGVDNRSNTGRHWALRPPPILTTPLVARVVRIGRDGLPRATNQIGRWTAQAVPGIAATLSGGASTVPFSKSSAEGLQAKLYHSESLFFTRSSHLMSLPV